jgi:hypothetical protein
LEQKFSVVLSVLNTKTENSIGGSFRQSTTDVLDDVVLYEGNDLQFAKRVFREAREDGESLVSDHAYFVKDEPVKGQITP